MNIFRKFVARLRFREAVKRADAAHVKNGHRYYILPTKGGKLVIMDRKNFRLLRSKRYIFRGAKVPDLVVKSLYFTPYRNGNGGITEEARQKGFERYLSFLEGKDGEGR